MIGQTKTNSDYFIKYLTREKKNSILSLLLRVYAIASHRGDVELVVPAFLAVEDPEGTQLGYPLVLEHDLEGCLAVVSIGNAKGADFTANRANLRRHLHEGLVLLHQAVISALEAVQFQTWR